MSKKPYRKRIVSNLEVLAEWDELGEAVSISTWDDEDVGDFFRGIADSVMEDMKNESTSCSVARAFKDARLTPEIPLNWFYLLQAFSDVHFHRKVTDRKYDESFKTLLWKRMKKIVDTQEKRNLAAACRVLVEKYPADYVTSGNDFRTKSTLRRSNEFLTAAKLLRGTIKDFGWSPDHFDSVSPPLGRK